MYIVRPLSAANFRSLSKSATPLPDSSYSCLTCALVCSSTMQDLHSFQLSCTLRKSTVQSPTTLSIWSFAANLKMNSANTNRDTLFQMEGLTGAEPVTSPTKPDCYVTKEPPPILDRSVLKKNAAKRKRTLSPPRRVGNRPGAQMEYKGMKDGSPWGSYWRSFQVKYTDFVTVAVRKGGRRKCVVVKSFLAGADSQQQPSQSRWRP